MTDKVKSAIYIYDTIYKRASKITLQCFLTRINNRTLDTSGTKVYFATMEAGSKDCGSGILFK